MNKALTIAGAIFSFLLVQLPSRAAPAPQRSPVIDITDLYHPHQDVGDNYVQVYYRGDPRANETALQEALPALYLSFQGNPWTKAVLEPPLTITSPR